MNLRAIVDLARAAGLLRVRHYSAVLAGGASLCEALARSGRRAYAFDPAGVGRIHRHCFSIDVAVSLGALLCELVCLGARGHLFLLGFSIYRAAFKSFDRAQVSGLAELEPDRHRQQLVTTGIRARVRHPIYLGHLCEILGWCIGTGLVALYALAGFAMITGALMIRMEDRELEARFGEAFRDYRQRVPAVVPSYLPR